MLTMKRIGAAVAVAATLGGSCLTAHAATTIDTSPFWSGSNVSPFGVQDTATYGQTFSVTSDNVLNNFTFYINDAGASGPITSQAYVFAWDGTKASGSSLFSTSPFVIAGAGGSDAYTINTGSLALTAGQQYVAFFTTSGLQAGQPGALDSWNLVNDDYSGGGFVYLNNGNNFGDLTTSEWNNFGGQDLRFQANFGGASAVPEPSSIAFLLCGAVVLGSLVLRRRYSAVS